MSKILILGGTGAMGEHLVQLLRNTDNEVAVTSRKAHTNVDNITYIQGNAHEETFLSELLQNDYDVIVDFMAYSTQEFKTKYMMILDHCKQYVFLSSSRAYANSKTRITEDSDLLADTCKDEEYIQTDEYALAKGRQENLLRTSGKKNWTIIRPYITYSEIRLQLGVLEKEEWLYRALHGRTIVFSEDIAQRYTTLTYGHDVATGFMGIISNPKAMGQAYHITVATPIQWSEVLQIYLEELENILGKRPKVMMTQESINLQSGRRWQVLYDRHYDRLFDNKKISAIVDTSGFLHPEDGLRNCIRSFCKHPVFRGIDWRMQAKYDRLTGDHASWTEFQRLKTWAKYIVYRYFYNA